MSVKAYPQLDAEALTLLRQRLAHHGGSRSALARELGFSRSGISQALDERYPANTAQLRARIIEQLADRVVCPHLSREIAPSECREARSRPLTACMASPDDVKHWQACQSCPQNPKRTTP